MSHDIKKAAVLYLGPEHNRAEFACDGCIMFIEETSECTIVDDSKVKAVVGGCGWWVGGPSIKKRATHPPMRLISKEDAGYSEDGPFTCKRCLNFVALDAYGACKLPVVYPVHKDGCCNGWDKNEFYQIENVKF